jgi:hypothetical protein
MKNNCFIKKIQHAGRAEFGTRVAETSERSLVNVTVDIWLKNGKKSGQVIKMTTF